MDEQQFKKSIIQIRALAKSQNEMISKEQVHEKFLPLDVSKEQFEFIYKYLEDQNVKLYESKDELAAASNKNSEAVLPGKSNPENDKFLNMYLEELECIPKLSKEERAEALEKVITNRNLAEDIIPNLYLREVVDIARLYSDQGVMIEDLIGEGNVGIMLGIKMLDCCESAAEIEEFIVKMIMDSMEALCLENLSKDDWDVKIVERANEVEDKAKELSDNLGRKVSVSELAKEFDLEEEFVIETLLLAGNKSNYIEAIDTI